jgi:predicted ATPase
MSNREIAEDLTVSVETVRWYSKQIYSKLDVHSRKEAIHKARELGFDTKTEILIAPQHNLPSTPTAFVGREQEMRELLRLITETETKLITILAAGGMGKTRLALAVAHKLSATSFPDGLYFVPLQPLSSSDHLVNTIGNYSNYQFQQDGRSAKQQVLDYLQEKQLILLLDNFEHLLSAASFISELLQTAPQVKILVTSRERLNIYGETIFAISGLSYSEDTRKPNDALKLFEYNARHLRPDWQISEHNLSALQQICAQVEGMPLGIELAAAWMDTLSPQEIAQEISASIDILVSSLQDIPERHRSMNAMLETTWQRLDEKLQTVFMNLSVFRGGFTREAAQFVAGMALQNLQVLIDKALIRRDGDGRFSIHELLRQFAEQKLQSHNLADEIQAAHLQYYADFIQEREIDIKGRRQLEGLKDFDADFENVRAAWQFAAE